MWLQRLFRSIRRTSDSELINRSTGSGGEEVAVRYLQERGYRILDRNWKCAIGEIDIIAKFQETCVIVEVKSSRRRSAITPEMRVNSKKQSKLRSLAAVYTKYRAVESPIRFDIVAVWLENGTARVHHIENAF